MKGFKVMEQFEFAFYVIDDLKKNGYQMRYFPVEDLRDALIVFSELDRENGKMPTLGVQAGDYGVDLIQCVNGVNVLSRDYQNDNLAGEILAIQAEVDEIVDWLVERGVVRHVYSHDFFDKIGRSCPVIVPVGQSDGAFDDRSCENKRLKTASRFGQDSINQLFLSGRGWVDYRNVLDNPDAYASNGVMFVGGVNVDYCLKPNLVGIDGQMDISPHDFSRMLEDVNKEFGLRVYDSYLEGMYIAASFEDIGSAVKAWYELPEGLTGCVQQTVGYSFQQVVFNGMDDKFEDIPFEKAARMYGFAVPEQKRGNLLVDDILAAAQAHARAGAAKSCVERGMEF